MATGTRQTADERRASVLAAAVTEFARGGLEGTSTEAIAAAVGISQPYLFRLFGSKKGLFLAAVKETFARTVTTFESAAGELTGEEALTAMAKAYNGLLAESSYLLMQMQAYAACGDPDIRVVTRRGFRDLWYTVERLAGLDVNVLRAFFAMGMLCNVSAAMDLPAVDERWAQIICPPDGPDSDMKATKEALARGFMGSAGEPEPDADVD
ncbi:TetR/AcrR family transcriptional regulator [Pseudofrankia asymbiotica]|uniref:TetR family transcriptional regulator n=1 Tax=Pseudofrankia asymbiotica TaxID=1834516 RepID=A0A1V2ICN3_9ACTN|nr:TetR/AcrR family transcriptional regulator [Pseudofrankia asymbiotica]ONH30780.1 TetR family transcriptional regulator [Pseudofrankia asymbiotica]